MRYIVFLTLILGLNACKNTPQTAENALFEAIGADTSGVTFNNMLKESDDWNIIQYLYFYNGGGVATGDVNNDGLVDIYFTSNQGSNKLYLNKGGFTFEDATEKAGVADAEGWKTGVTMADVNSDGWLDLYVSHVSNYKGWTGSNRLFMNNGDGTFTDKAADIGLNINGLCTQAGFFDADGDGDLDCYILRHSVHSARSYRPISARNDVDPMAGDLLLRNFGGRFEDVSAKSGIKDGSLGYGLGLAIGDLNNDGHPDIYVGNDFHDNDYLYWNNGDGTFTEGMSTAMGHNSNFSMGNDMADVNNDGWLDYIGLDMKPEYETILKASAGAEAYNIFDFKNKEFGYHYQFPRNMLQINQGNIGGKTAEFAEIGQFAGISATDWSWSALWADWDNDGWKDLFITNGIMRRPNDLDYIKYISNENTQKGLSDLQLAQQMPEGKVANYAYKNNQDLTFSDVSQAWGLDLYGLSSGAAYADFDNDGDLDLVVNNTNARASLYRNKANQTGHHFLKVVLEGKLGNTQGIGAKVVAYAQGQMQILENQPTRGFQSSSDPVLHFGFDKKITQIDSVRVVWRDGSTELLPNVSADYTLVVQQKNAKGKYIFNPKTTTQTARFHFTNVSAQWKLPFVHKENSFYDVDKEKLMPHFLSTEGPKIAVGDVNGDGKEDFYVCGAKNQAGVLFLHQKNGFAPLATPVFEEEAFREDVDAAFFDADGDKDLDLYVVSGGFDDVPQDRLYKNDGKGHFMRDTEGALPVHNGSCVRPFDFDGDGDKDLFVGSRSDVRDYGVVPKSFLLQNDGKGHFTDVSAQFAPFFQDLGMVTDAVWTDLNGDGLTDLVVVGEWMPISILYHKKDHFERTQIEHTGGWWQALQAADLDNDGDQDLVIGNMGLNSDWRASVQQPLSLYVKDFDNNGDKEPILAYFKQNIEWPYATKDELSAQMPILRKKFVDYAPFAKSSFNEVFSKKQLKGAVASQMQQLASVCLINNGKGELELKPLPSIVQWSAVRAIHIEDLDKDGHLDLAIGGNFYEMHPALGRLDASIGHILKGDGQGHFSPLSAQQTGWILRGAIRDIKTIGNHYIVAANNAPLQIFERR